MPKNSRPKNSSHSRASSKHAKNRECGSDACPPRAFRLPAILRAYLILELVATDKPTAAVARKFGVASSTVRNWRRRLRCAAAASTDKIRYRPDGTPYWSPPPERNLFPPAAEHRRGALPRVFERSEKKTRGGTRCGEQGGDAPGEARRGGDGAGRRDASR